MEAAVVFYWSIVSSGVIVCLQVLPSPHERLLFWIICWNNLWSLLLIYFLFLVIILPMQNRILWTNHKVRQLAHIFALMLWYCPAGCSTAHLIIDGLVFKLTLCLYIQNAQSLSAGGEERSRLSNGLLFFCRTRMIAWWSGLPFSIVTLPLANFYFFEYVFEAFVSSE